MMLMSMSKNGGIKSDKDLSPNNQISNVQKLNITVKSDIDLPSNFNSLETKHHGKI